MSQLTSAKNNRFFVSGAKEKRLEVPAELQSIHIKTTNQARNLRVAVDKHFNQSQDQPTVYPFTNVSRMLVKVLVHPGVELLNIFLIFIRFSGIKDLTSKQEKRVHVFVFSVTLFTP